MGAGEQLYQFFEKTLDKTWFPLLRWLLNRRPIREIIIELNDSLRSHLKDGSIEDLKEALNLKDQVWQSIKLTAKEFGERADRLEEEKRNLKMEMENLQKAKESAVEMKNATIGHLIVVCHKFIEWNDRSELLEEIVGHIALVNEQISYNIVAALKQIIFVEMPYSTVSSILKSMQNKDESFLRRLIILQLLAEEKCKPAISRPINASENPNPQTLKNAGT